MNLEHIKKLRESFGTAVACVVLYEEVGAYPEQINQLVLEFAQGVGGPRGLELLSDQYILEYFQGFLEGMKDGLAIQEEWCLN